MNNTAGRRNMTDLQSVSSEIQWFVIRETVNKHIGSF